MWLTLNCFPCESLAFWHMPIRRCSPAQLWIKTLSRMSLPGWRHFTHLLLEELSASYVTPPGEDPWKLVRVFSALYVMAFALCWFCFLSAGCKKSQFWVPLYHEFSKSSRQVTETGGDLGESLTHLPTVKRTRMNHSRRTTKGERARWPRLPAGIPLLRADPAPRVRTGPDDVLLMNGIRQMWRMSLLRLDHKGPPRLPCPHAPWLFPFAAS